MDHTRYRRKMNDPRDAMHQPRDPGAVTDIYTIFRVGRLQVDRHARNTEGSQPPGNGAAYETA
jgi:hypothetical protein